MPAQHLRHSLPDVDATHYEALAAPHATPHAAHDASFRSAAVAFGAALARRTQGEGYVWERYRNAAGRGGEAGWKEAAHVARSFGRYDRAKGSFRTEWDSPGAPWVAAECSRWLEAAVRAAGCADGLLPLPQAVVTTVCVEYHGANAQPPPLRVQADAVVPPVHPSAPPVSTAPPPPSLTALASLLPEAARECVLSPAAAVHLAADGVYYVQRPDVAAVPLPPLRVAAIGGADLILRDFAAGAPGRADLADYANRYLAAVYQAYKRAKKQVPEEQGAWRALSSAARTLGLNAEWYTPAAVAAAVCRNFQGYIAELCTLLGCLMRGGSLVYEDAQAGDDDSNSDSDQPGRITARPPPGITASADGTYINATYHMRTLPDPTPPQPSTPPASAPPTLWGEYAAALGAVRAAEGGPGAVAALRGMLPVAARLDDPGCWCGVARQVAALAPAVYQDALLPLRDGGVDSDGEATASESEGCASPRSAYSSPMSTPRSQGMSSILQDLPETGRVDASGFDVPSSAAGAALITSVGLADLTDLCVVIEGLVCSRLAGVVAAGPGGTLLAPLASLWAAVAPKAPEALRLLVHLHRSTVAPNDRVTRGLATEITYLYVAQGRFAEAKAYLVSEQQAHPRRSDPAQQPYLQQAYGYLYYQLGKHLKKHSAHKVTKSTEGGLPPKARQAFLRAVESLQRVVDGGDDAADAEELAELRVVALSNLASCHAELGDRGEAKAMLEAAAACDAADDEVQALLQRNQAALEKRPKRTLTIAAKVIQRNYRLVRRRRLLALLQPRLTRVGRGYGGRRGVAALKAASVPPEAAADSSDGEVEQFDNSSSSSDSDSSDSDSSSSSDDSEDSSSSDSPNEYTQAQCIAAGETIQRMGRGWFHRRYMVYLLDVAAAHRQNAAALKVQRMGRGWFYRRYMVYLLSQVPQPGRGRASSVSTSAEEEDSYSEDSSYSHGSSDGVLSQSGDAKDAQRERARAASLFAPPSGSTPELPPAGVEGDAASEHQEPDEGRDGTARILTPLPGITQEQEPSPEPTPAESAFESIDPDAVPGGTPQLLEDDHNDGGFVQSPAEAAVPMPPAVAERAEEAPTARGRSPAEDSPAADEASAAAAAEGEAEEESKQRKGSAPGSGGKRRKSSAKKRRKSKAKSGAEAPAQAAEDAAAAAAEEAAAKDRAGQAAGLEAEEESERLPIGSCEASEWTALTDAEADGREAVAAEEAQAAQRKAEEEAAAAEVAKAADDERQAAAAAQKKADEEAAVAAKAEEEEEAAANKCEESCTPPEDAPPKSKKRRSTKGGRRSRSTTPDVEGAPSTPKARRRKSSKASKKSTTSFDAPPPPAEDAAGAASSDDDGVLSQSGDARSFAETQRHLSEVPVPGEDHEAADADDEVREVPTPSPPVEDAAPREEELPAEAPPAEPKVASPMDDPFEGLPVADAPPLHCVSPVQTAFESLGAGEERELAEAPCLPPDSVHSPDEFDHESEAGVGMDEAEATRLAGLLLQRCARGAAARQGVAACAAPTGEASSEEVDDAAPQGTADADTPPPPSSEGSDEYGDEFESPPTPGHDDAAAAEKAAEEAVAKERQEEASALEAEEESERCTIGSCEASEWTALTDAEADGREAVAAEEAQAAQRKAEEEAAAAEAVVASEDADETVPEDEADHATPKSSSASTEALEDAAAMAQRNRAATRIQAVHRGNEGRQAAARRRTAALAARRLQAAHRGHCGRRAAAVLRYREAVARLHVVYCGYTARRDVARTAAAVRLQALLRGNTARGKAAALQEKQARARKAKAEREQEAATAIQAVQRGRSARKEAKQRAEAKAAERDAAAGKIQAVHRGNAARRRAAQERKARSDAAAEEALAAVKIQTAYRGHAACKEAEARRTERASEEKARAAAAQATQADKRSMFDTSSSRSRSESSHSSSSSADTRSRTSASDAANDLSQDAQGSVHEERPSVSDRSADAAMLQRVGRGAAARARLRADALCRVVRSRKRREVQVQGAPKAASPRPKPSVKRPTAHATPPRLAPAATRAQTAGRRAPTVSPPRPKTASTVDGRRSRSPLSPEGAMVPVEGWAGSQAQADAAVVARLKQEGATLWQEVRVVRQRLQEHKKDNATLDGKLKWVSRKLERAKEHKTALVRRNQCLKTRCNETLGEDHLRARIAECVQEAAKLRVANTRLKNSQRAISGKLMRYDDPSAVVEKQRRHFVEALRVLEKTLVELDESRRRDQASIAAQAARIEELQTATEGITLEGTTLSATDVSVNDIRKAEHLAEELAFLEKVEAHERRRMEVLKKEMVSFKRSLEVSRGAAEQSEVTQLKLEIRAMRSRVYHNRARPQRDSHSPPSGSGSPVGSPRYLPGGLPPASPRAGIPSRVEPITPTPPGTRPPSGTHKTV